MLKFLLLAGLSAGTMSLLPWIGGAEPALPDRPAVLMPRTGLSLAGARVALEGALADSQLRGASPSIAVVDESGVLLAFARADGSFAAGAQVSIGKARTAALFRKPTRVFEDLINKGRFALLDATTQPDFTPLQGGVPIVIDGLVVGAIGVSGAASAEQDEQVAMAGAAVIIQTVAQVGAK